MSAQVIIWAAAPAMIRVESTTPVMTVLLVPFLFEYLPKIYHAVRFLRPMQNAFGYAYGLLRRRSRESLAHRERLEEEERGQYGREKRKRKKKKKTPGVALFFLSSLPSGAGRG
uniref:Uncharacterized protein n=1 Tax=Oryza brachyantha TaxID=4533 RepID=J3N8E6_ORYBR